MLKQICCVILTIMGTLIKTVTYAWLLLLFLCSAKYDVRLAAITLVFIAAIAIISNQVRAASVYRYKATSVVFKSEHELLDKFSQPLFLALAVLSMFVLVFAFQCTWTLNSPSMSDLYTMCTDMNVTDDAESVHTIAGIFKSFPAPYTRLLYNQYTAVMNQNDVQLQRLTELRVLCQRQGIVAILLWLLYACMQYPAQVLSKYVAIRRRDNANLDVQNGPSGMGKKAYDA
ncbi:MAG: hypothetical protein NC548_31505 [Lachnospiraceae bacterium]|nr:hypothetical protein [Lachnospiraceae bacterium]